MNPSIVYFLPRLSPHSWQNHSANLSSLELYGIRTFILLPLSIKYKYIAASVITCSIPSSVMLTPVRTVGAIDQHSQIQLFREGPLDKVVTFIGLETHDNDVDS